MGSLSAALNIALRSMLTEQGAIATTSNNIANVNTPGYARQVPDLTETQPVTLGNLTFGTGVQMQQVTSLRDSILDLRVNQETQQQGQLNSFLGPAQQIQALFNETSGSGLQNSLTSFFSSFSQLSTNPSNLNARQGVLTAGQNLATAFNQSANNLVTLQRNVDLSISQSVTQVNTLATQIAAVNTQVTAATESGQSAGPFIDQRQQLLTQLSNLVDVSEIDAGHGSLTLTTSSGAPLVVGGQSYQLTTQPDSVTGLQHVFSQGQDITSRITSGQLAGQLQMRDREIPSLEKSLDTLASGIANAVNTQHQAGFDLNGAAGGNFFVPPPANGVGAASALSVAITDPTKVAASANGAVGDNANSNAILAIQNQAVAGGQTPINYYAGIVFNLGNDISSAQTQQQSGALVLAQIQNLQGGVSGVDLNEEAANLIRFQNAYTAAAQVSSIINTLLQTTINMVQ
jgi:flagellar hook-associated protein 1 FlgK